MRRGKIGHAIEGEVDRRHVAGVHRSTKAFLAVPAVNPAVCKTILVRGLMIMEHAFRHMQDFFPEYSLVRERFQHVVKVAVIGFIAANILCGHDRIKSYPKALIGA